MYRSVSVSGRRQASTRIYQPLFPRIRKGHSFSSLGVRQWATTEQRGVFEVLSSFYPAFSWHCRKIYWAFGKWMYYVFGILPWWHQWQLVFFGIIIYDYYYYHLAFIFSVSILICLFFLVLEILALQLKLILHLNIIWICTFVKQIIGVFYKKIKCLST